MVPPTVPADPLGDDRVVALPDRRRQQRGLLVQVGQALEVAPNQRAHQQVAQAAHRARGRQPAGAQGVELRRQVEPGAVRQEIEAGLGQGGAALALKPLDDAGLIGWLFRTRPHHREHRVRDLDELRVAVDLDSRRRNLPLIAALTAV